MRTTFIIFNPTGVPDTATIRLTDNDAQPFVVTIPGLGTNSSFGPLTIGPGQTKIYQTDGAGALKPGAARVESQRPLGVSAIFTMYINGAFTTQAGVGSSELMTNFVLPVDASSGFNTGVAIFAQQTTSLTYTLRRLDGTVAGTKENVQLQSQKHVATFVAGGDGLFPNAANFTRGTLEVTATNAVAAVVLRQNGAALSTLPVVAKDSSTTDFNLPQIANGVAGSLSMKTTFILFNLSDTEVIAEVSIKKPNGTQFPIVRTDNLATVGGAQPAGLPAQVIASDFAVHMKPGVSAFITSTGAGDLSAGSAQVQSDAPIGVSAIYTLYDNNVFQTEAGVGDSPMTTDFTLPVDNSGASSTSVALFNPNDFPVNVSVWRNDENGASAGTLTTPITLQPFQQTAKSLTELFPGATNVRGSMGISSPGAISAVAVLTNSAPLSYTTLPVVQGNFEGTVPAAAPLLSKQRSGIAATTNATVNETLSPGFRLSGTVGGPVGNVSSVTARSTAAGGLVYGAAVDFQTNKYVIVVPAGTYELNVCYSPASQIPLGLPSLTYTAQPNVTVNADTVRDLAVPAVTLRQVMGTVTGANPLGGALMGLLRFASEDHRTGGNATVAAGMFTAQLPDGTYTVDLALTAFGGGQISLGFYNIGTLTVSGGGTGNFAVPATVQLSGTVSRAGAAGVPANSMIFASDTSVPVPTSAQLACASSAGGSMGSIDPGTGAYQLLVPQGRPLGSNLMMPVSQTGYVMFPADGRNLGSLSANRTENYNVPALPGMVTISGKVTDNQGQGVAGVSVSAMSKQITGAAQVYFITGAETDGSGNYTVQVLNGTNYDMMFAPPPPQP